MAGVLRTRDFVHTPNTGTWEARWTGIAVVIQQMGDTVFFPGLMSFITHSRVLTIFQMKNTFSISIQITVGRVPLAIQFRNT